MIVGVLKVKASLLLQALSVAALDNALDVVQMLLDRGAKVRARDVMWMSIFAKQALLLLIPVVQCPI